MNLSASEKLIEKEYHVSWFIIAYKLSFGLVEFILGIGISLFSQSALHYYRIYIAQELFEDPHDLLVRLTQGIIPNVLTHHTTIVLYLIILGAAKIAGAIGLIYQQNWGVDLLIGLTLLMLPFQLVQLYLHPSLPDFIYIFTGLVIAMYLVNFQPQKWAKRIAGKFSKK